MCHAVRLLVGAALALSAGLTVSAQSDAVGMEAQFRGCDAAGWCLFSLEGSRELYRVRPDGIAQVPRNSARSIAVRDRLNGLLSSMIHQHKRIVLHGLRDAGDGMYTATVIVNEADVAQDEVLRGLEIHTRNRGQIAARPRDLASENLPGAARQLVTFFCLAKRK